MKLTPVLTGYLKLDGGAMFGVVPKRMWEKFNPPDENNMCTWAMRALLVESGERKVLIDTGIGNKQDERFRSHFEPRDTDLLFRSLANAGAPREAITDVFLTHLHFDHCGGALWRNEQSGTVELAFPNAEYWTNRPHLEWALHPNAREKASFLQENFMPLQEAGRLRFISVQENAVFFPGFSVRFLYGHTEAMMSPVLETDRGTIVYCADLAPSQWHVGLPYVMAYDIRPLQTLEEKSAILEEAAEKGHILFFEHDPVAEACRVKFDTNGRIIVAQTGNLTDLLG